MRSILTAVLAFAALVAAAGLQLDAGDATRYRNAPSQDVAPSSPGPTDPNGPPT